MRRSLFPHCMHCYRIADNVKAAAYVYIWFVFPYLQLSHRVGDLLIRIQVLLVYRYSLQLDGIISVLDGIWKCTGTLTRGCNGRWIIMWRRLITTQSFQRMFLRWFIVTLTFICVWCASDLFIHWRRTWIWVWEMLSVIIWRNRIQR